MNQEESEPPFTEPPSLGALPPETLRTAGRVIGIEFTDEELELMRTNVAQNLDLYRRLRARSLTNDVAPTLVFDPALDGIEVPPETGEPAPRDTLEGSLPEDPSRLASLGLRTLGALIRSRQVSCVELTEASLARLKAIDRELHCVISLCSQRALEQARALDRELAEGRYRGPLHGIPWGAKDLFAVRGTRTTWGARPFEQQRIEVDAAVVERLDAAGAVLVAKLSLGALAWGDVWFGERTRNPWMPDAGSSGSSAGPAAAVAAGGVAFAIGTETCGSIVSPSATCGNTSLRPTFGRVSRHGAMALAWSLDKVGPVCRSAVDANLVFQAIVGADSRDPGAVERPFTDLGPQSIEGWKIGFLPANGDPSYEAVLAELRGLGAQLVPAELPSEPRADDLLIILWVEAAAAFDALTRDGRDDQLVRQVEMAWPNMFRVARLVPAVEYINADRQRRQLMLAVAQLWSDLDVLVHPTEHGQAIVTFNLTGNPTVCAPSGFRADGTPRSVSFSGPLFSESRLLAITETWQRVTRHHERHPQGS